MAKIVITPEQLAAIASGPNYYVRFRVVSEDRNRYSAWTPVFTVSS